MVPIYKILLIGAGDVGKTTWLRRFITGEFRSVSKTDHEEIRILSLHTSSGLVRLEIWDRWDAERETQNSVNAKDDYYDNVDGIIGLFDVTKPQTFDSVMKQMDQVKQKCKPKFAISVGNKCDLLEKKKYMDAYPFADYFISANTNRNYELPFLHALKILRNDPSLKLVEASPISAPEAKRGGKR